MFPEREVDGIVAFVENYVSRGPLPALSQVATGEGLIGGVVEVDGRNFDAWSLSSCAIFSGERLAWSCAPATKR